MLEANLGKINEEKQRSKKQKNVELHSSTMQSTYLKSGYG